MEGRFQFNKTLGEGAFGKVYLVTDTSNNDKYAMKVIDLRTSPQDEKDMALAEAQLLKKLRHEHVLSYTDSFENDGALCIVTEYCANGDLSLYLEKRHGVKLEEDRLISWFSQITSAVKYLHDQKIIHRDLKTPNVFLTQTWDTKLGDLGLAKVLERPNAKAVTFCGSPYYMSPEIFSCKPYDNKSDIWALGVIVYEMATLERPFDAMLMHQLVFKIVHGGLPKMPDGYPGGLSDLLSKMMQKDSAKRPTADDILKHPLFQNRNKPKPVVPPQRPAPPAAAGAAAGGRWAGIIQRKEADGKKKEAGKAGPFAMKVLLDSLSQVRQKREERDKQAKAAGASPKLDTILAKNYDSSEDFDKTMKALPSKSFKQMSVASVSDVDILLGDELDKTLKASGVKAERDAFNVMQLVVRTLTGVFHGQPVPSETSTGGQGDPQTMLLRQIEQLQFYVIKVMENDMSLFQKAYDMLGAEKDENKLEEKLIKIIGKEKFGMCGVQLMYLKNFEYNLNKLIGTK